MAGASNRGLLVLLVLLPWGTALDLPSNFIRCKRTDPDINNCIKNAIQDALPKLEKGLPEFNFPPAQPLLVSNIVVGKGNGPVDVMQNFSNVNIYNLIRAKINKVDLQLGEHDISLEINGYLKTIKFVADYELNGRVLLLPIVGSGKATVIFRDSNVNIVVKGKDFQRKGETYIEFVDYKFELMPSKMEFHLDNLFNGNERLGSEMNNLLNENWREIWEDIKGGYVESFSLILMDLINKIFKKVPFRQIF